MTAFKLKGIILMASLAGYKTYIAAVGLLCHGVYLITQGQINEGLAEILQAATVAGLRSAIR